MCSGQTIPEFQAAGLNAAKANGFENDGTNTVAINVPPTNASITISAECTGCFVEAVVSGQIPGTFISMFYKGPLASTSQAIAACNPNKNGDEPDNLGIRAMFALGTGCAQQLTVSGAGVFIDGGLHSNDNLHLSGGGGTATVIGPASYETTLQLNNSGTYDFQTGSYIPPGPTGSTTGGKCRSSCFETPGGTPTCEREFFPEHNPFKLCDQKNDPLAATLHVSDYAPGGPKTVNAVAANQYHAYTSNCGGNNFKTWLAGFITNGVIQDGLYYTTCNIKVTDRISGRATFVTTDGIDISGGFNLVSYQDDLLFFATGGTNTCGGSTGVSLKGSDNSFDGNIYAPHTQVDLSGADNHTNHGCIVAWGVNFSGSNTQVICNPTDPAWSSEPVIWLPE